MDFSDSMDDDDWEKCVEGSDEPAPAPISIADLKKQAKLLEEKADLETASDLFSGVLKPDGTMNTRVKAVDTPVTNAAPSKPAAKTRTVNIGEYENPWDRISMRNVLDYDNVASELTKKIQQGGTNINGKVLTRFALTLLASMDDKLEKVHYDLIFNQLKSQSISNRKKKAEVKIQKAGRAFVRDPIKAEMEDMLDGEDYYDEEDAGDADYEAFM